MRFVICLYVYMRFVIYVFYLLCTVQHPLHSCTIFYAPCVLFCLLFKVHLKRGTRMHSKWVPQGLICCAFESGFKWRKKRPKLLVCCTAPTQEKKKTRRRRKPGEKIQEKKKTTWEKKRINPGEGGKWKEALLGWQIQGDCGREDTPMQAGFILASLHSRTVLCNKVLLQKASLQFDSRKAGRLGANCAIVCLWTICTIHVCNASLIWSICATESSSVKLHNAESALQMHCNRRLGFWLRLKEVKSAF